MSAEEVLRQIEKEGIEVKTFLRRFLSNLFTLFGGELPPAIEEHVAELLALLQEKEPLPPAIEYRQAA
jgi:hypothetical protein